VDIAVLAALNIANSLVAEREARSKGSAVPEGRIAQLVERLEAAVGGAAARSN
jgi:cell division protein ZapA (FtsZ GTPase activity inhibitor)